MPDTRIPPATTPRPSPTASTQATQAAQAATAGDKAAPSEPGAISDSAETVLGKVAALLSDASPAPADPGLLKEIQLRRIVAQLGDAITPKMTVHRQYPGLRGQVFELEFDRALSRQELGQFLYPEGNVPDEFVDHGMKYVGDKDPSRRPLLESGNPKAERSRTWRISLPTFPTNFRTTLNDGVDDRLLAAPGLSVPPWVPEASASALKGNFAPKPGDPRFDRVKNDFPKPYEHVIVWRQGDLVFRMDKESGAIAGYRDLHGPYTHLFNQLMEKYVEREGMDLREALDRMDRDVRAAMLSGITMFAIGSARGSSIIGGPGHF